MNRRKRIPGSAPAKAVVEVPAPSNLPLSKGRVKFSQLPY